MKPTPSNCTMHSQDSFPSGCGQHAVEQIAFCADEVECSLTARFGRIARQTAEHLAMVSSNDRITYRQLDDASDRLAHAILRRRGSGAEPVAVVARQGIPAAVATLGVLKAGKFFVPLDPNYPTER